MLNVWKQTFHISLMRISEKVEGVLMLNLQHIIFVWRRSVSLKLKQETLRVVTIAMICSTLAWLWKFQHFRRPIYDPVEHLWWSFYCENSKLLNIFTRKLHRRCSLRFYIHLCFFKTLRTFYFFKLFYIKTLEICYFFKYFTSFNSSNLLLNT